ncbi:helix-turn-helix domain-containing protein [Streptomyces sp. NBC_00690]|uniref:helix-turn-helix domain-containing protein n=1 Tax=Streptomyces sp. NBC_00690 TaxID=2975808 RepID=UPI002E27F91A|nr:Scr1 family TA system antitoxin-like transcriptional regulator [Streptomyces sp. NBC_00690]
MRDARELRHAGKWTQMQLAKAVRTSSSTISRLESGEGPVPSDLPPLLDQVFMTDGLFKRLYGEIQREGFPVHSRRRIRLEPDAAAIAEWSQTVVPGLVQTPAYAHALFRQGDPRAGDSEIRAMVDKRMARQDVFLRSSPPDFSVVICESVLRRTVGGEDVMRDQLGALLSHGARRTSVVQVLPLSAGCHGLMDGPISILTALDGSVIVYAEGVRSGAIIEDPNAVKQLTRSYNLVTASALSPDASAQLILKLMEAP